jgi:hypothetical protein
MIASVDEKSGFPRIRAIIFTTLGIVLTWQVLSHSLVAYLAEVSPQTAVSLRSNDPKALVNIADRKLNLERPANDREAPTGTLPTGDARDRIPSFARYARKMAGANTAQTEGEHGQVARLAERIPPNAADPDLRKEVRALAEAALNHDPMNARALRILGQIADAANDEIVASKFMQAAVRHSLRERVAVVWLMGESFERKDYAAAVQYADILLRTRPQIVERVVPTLARIAEDRDNNDELKKLLASNPPWRAQFFPALLRHITDARTPLDLLLSIKDTATPPTTADLRSYLDLLIQNNFHELAYYVWLHFLSPEQLANTGLVFNGGFENRPSGLPFDWVVTQGQGVTIDFAQRDDAGGRALLVEFGQGRVDFRGISQMVMLAPGTYRLKGQYRGQIVGRRGLEWRIHCAGATDLLAKSEMVTGATPVWTEFAVTFGVPPAGCRAQQLRLWLDARSASEQLVTGTLWYDNLQIEQLQEQENSARPVQ